MGFAWDFLIILKSASRSGQKASKTIGYSDGCANVRIHGAKQGTAGAWLRIKSTAFLQMLKNNGFCCVFNVIAYHIETLIKRGGFGGPGK